MIGFRVTYEDLCSFLRQNVAEWVDIIFSRSSFSCMLHINEIEKNGFVKVNGWEYNMDDINRILLEEVGVINDFSFGPGPNEGYKIIIRFESGQVIWVKTFERDSFKQLFDWVQTHGTN